MHSESLRPWQHDHIFGQDERRAGERRTLAVMLLTAAMMVIEIAAGLAFGSMALLADGLHMASHAAALGIAVVAYIYARRYAADRRFTFGTGKVNALAGYSSALLLALFAALMAWESAVRLLTPQPIAFDQAMFVALLGLGVNLVSLLLLRGGDDDHHHHSHAHPHHDDHRHAHVHTGEADALHQDHNLRGAYLHVLADALTSVLALVSLGVGWLRGWTWPDATVGLLGAVLVGRWAFGLIRDTGSLLLDRGAPDALQAQVRDAIESDGDARIADLHIWSLGTQGYAAALSVVAHQPKPPAMYSAMIPATAGIVHTTVEVHQCHPR